VAGGIEDARDRGMEKERKGREREGTSVPK
jgi:hypothetical protein